MGKKQLGILLLLKLMRQAAIGDIHKTLGAGSYKTVQAALNKLTTKGYLATTKKGYSLFYSLTAQGLKETETITSALCAHCVTLDLARGLYS
jgi:DNA-binding transcriptional regulator PaaX